PPAQRPNAARQKYCAAARCPAGTAPSARAGLQVQPQPRAHWPDGLLGRWSLGRYGGHALRQAGRRQPRPGVGAAGISDADLSGYQLQRQPHAQRLAG
nr:hypothetical protein [Tanacetum cinerariifolium]